MQGKESSSTVIEQHPSCSIRLQMPGDGPESSSSGGQVKSSNQIMEPSNKEVMPVEYATKRMDLSLKIPPRPVCFGSKPNGKGLLHLDSFSRGCSSARGFLQDPSFKNQVSVVDERTPLLNSDHGERSDLMIPENSSMGSYIAALTSWKRCASLPVTPASNLSPSVSSPARETTFSGPLPSYKRTTPANIPRSLSAPMRNVLILRSASFSTPKELGQTDTNDGHASPANLADGDEEIPEDEAICRICFEELCGRSSLKLECSCRGALRLMHVECAVKWFGNKGNKKCDVCVQEIFNLPVTLFRLQSSAQGDVSQQHIRYNSSSQLMRAWQDVVVLVLISTMWYFFFLEQLLVDDMRSQAILIAAPFSFTLGLLQSMSAICLAWKDYVWSYSAFQFVLVVIFLQLFYSVLHVSAVYAILFASLVGFGIAVGINSLVMMIFAWRTRAVTTEMNSNLV
eukprot:TRINITY_DN1425_c0_g2_i2.p1 TRINITY_DN1425_c0_g2~~TRINITY_DN1425_c0_g2_i2.p1  ORF type:complete len:455 (+),score=89.72 TRINITY_DN1425_c0_g2_i2:171-1535(+)